MFDAIIAGAEGLEDIKDFGKGSLNGCNIR